MLEVFPFFWIRSNIIFVETLILYHPQNHMSHLADDCFSSEARSSMTMPSYQHMRFHHGDTAVVILSFIYRADFVGMGTCRVLFFLSYEIYPSFRLVACVANNYCAVNKMTWSLFLFDTVCFHLELGMLLGTYPDKIMIHRAPFQHNNRLSYVWCFPC